MPVIAYENKQEESEPQYSKMHLMHMADTAADYYGIPQDMTRAQIRLESSWNPNALSPKGALGISQFITGTAKSYFPEGSDLSGGPKDVRRDPQQSIDAQCRYLLDLYKQAGNSWEGALMGYYTGRTFPTPAGRKYVQQVLGKRSEEEELHKWAPKPPVQSEFEKHIEKLSETDVLAKPVANFIPLEPAEKAPEEYTYNLLKQGVPATERGVEEPPWFNPPLLAASLLSGGLTAGPLAAAKMAPGMILGSVAGAATQDVADLTNPKWGWVAGLAADMLTGMASQKAIDKWATRLAASRGLRGKQALELAVKLRQEVDSAAFQDALKAAQAKKALPAPAAVDGTAMGPEIANPNAPGELVPGFTMQEPQTTIRRPQVPPPWKTGQYPEVWTAEQGKAVMSPETFQNRANMAQGFSLQEGANLPGAPQVTGLPVATAPAAPVAPVAAAAIPAQPIDPRVAAKAAFKFKTAQEFAQAMGDNPLLPGFANWDDFFTKIRGGVKPAALATDLSRAEIKPNTKINDITAGRFWDLVADGDYPAAVKELQHASKRFAPDAVDDEFGINKAWGKLARKFNLDERSHEDRGVLKQMVKAYEDNVFKPFKGGAAVENLLPAAGPGGGPPPGKPYLAASFSDPKTGLRYEWHNMPEPESGRLVYQEMYRGDDLVNKGILVTGSKEKVQEFLNSDPSGRYQAAQKYNPSRSILGSETGAIYPLGGGPRVREELPSAAQLARDLVGLSEQGVNPEQALSQLARIYKRKPQEIVDVLQGANSPSVIKSMPEAAAGEQGPIVKIDRNTGEQVTAPPVYEGEATHIQNYIAKTQEKGDLPGWATLLGPKWTVETAARTFEHRLPEFKGWYHTVQEAGANAYSTYKNSFLPELERVENALPKGSSKRIGAYMAAQSPTGAATLEQMGMAVPKLTPQETEAVEWFRGTWDSFFNELNAARKAAGKAQFGKVDNYYTFMRKFNIWRELGFDPIWADAGVLERAAADFINPRTTPFRWATKRKGGFDPIELDSFSVMRMYARGAYDHINLSPPIGKYREMLNKITMPDGQSFNMKTDAPNTFAFLTQWLNNVSGKTMVEFMPRTDRALIALSRNNTFAVLSGYLGSALKQPFALRNTWVEIGPKYMAQGLADNLNPAKRAFADSKFAALITREFDASVRDAMAMVTSRVKGTTGEVLKGIKKGRAAAGHALMAPLEWLDYEAARATGLGAYRKATTLMSLPEKEAIRYANDAIIKTQGSAARWDVAPIQRQPLGRVVGPLQTFVINEWGWLTKDVLGMGNVKMTNKDAFKKVLSLVAATTLFNTLYEDVAGIPSPFPTPVNTWVEAQKAGKNPAIETVKDVSQLVPIIGGGLKYGKTPLGATMQLLETARQGGTPSMPMGEVAARVAGVPGAMQASRLMRVGPNMTLKEALVGKTNPYKRKTEWGDWSKEQKW